MGTKFWCQQKFFITLPICCQFKKNLFEVWFFTIFYVFFSHVYSPRQGLTTHWGQKFYDNRKAFSLCPYVASFKMISSKSDLHTFLMILYMYIAPGQGQKTPWGQTFDVNRKPLSLRTFCCKFQTNLFEFWFYTHFLMFFHMYIARGRGRQMSTEKPCHFAHLLQVSKKYLWSLILYIIFHVFIHVYSPGQGQTTPWGQNFFININLLSLWSFSVSFFH